MEIQGKYIKDEEGNIISPITSASTVYDSDDISLNDSCYLMSKKYDNQTMYSGSFTKINFISEDLINNIDLTAGVVTISQPGLYLIHLHVLFKLNTSDVTCRVFPQIRITHIGLPDQGKLYTLRGTDIKACTGDAMLNDIWLTQFDSGDSFYTEIYVNGSTGYPGYIGEGSNEVFSYLFVKRICSI